MGNSAVHQPSAAAVRLTGSQLVKSPLSSTDRAPGARTRRVQVPAAAARTSKPAMPNSAGLVSSRPWRPSQSGLAVRLRVVSRRPTEP
jgi:hypothetical protein